MEPTVDTWLLDVERGAARTAELPPNLGMPGTPTLDVALADAEEAVR